MLLLRGLGGKHPESGFQTAGPSSSLLSAHRWLAPSSSRQSAGKLHGWPRRATLAFQFKTERSRRAFSDGYTLSSCQPLIVLWALLRRWLSLGLGSELCHLRAASCPHVMWIKTVFSRIISLNVSQFVKMFPLGGTCSWTCKALGLTGDSFLLGWVHQLMSVDGIASRREAWELCKWRPSQ